MFRVYLYYGISLIFFCLLSLSTISHAQFTIEKAWQLTNGYSLSTNSNIYTSLQTTTQQKQPKDIVLEIINHDQSLFLQNVVARFGVPFPNRNSAFDSNYGDAIATFQYFADNNISYDQIFKQPAPVICKESFCSGMISKYDSILLDKDLSQIYSEFHNSKPEQSLGIYNTHQYGSANFLLGTNRRAIKKIMSDFLCMDIEHRKNFDLPPNWISKDVNRRPSGDATLFTQKCLGCHAFIDGGRPAFAYVDYTPRNGTSLSQEVRQKMNSNSHVFRFGTPVTSDTWINYLFENNPEYAFGSEYTGIESFLDMVTKQPEFSTCFVEKIHKSTCENKPMSKEQKEQIAASNKSNLTFNNVFTEVLLNVCI